jgi:hypothetical protein
MNVRTSLSSGPPGRLLEKLSKQRCLAGAGAGDDKFLSTFRLQNSVDRSRKLFFLFGWHSDILAQKAFRGIPLRKPS